MFRMANHQRKFLASLKSLKMSQIVLDMILHNYNWSFTLKYNKKFLLVWKSLSTKACENALVKGNR